MMARLSTARIVFIVAAALLIMECLGTPSSHRRPGSNDRCKNKTCTKQGPHAPTLGCPLGCGCGLDKTLNFPKTGFCF
uniref:Hypothetical secreted peptide n=1 Tax=Rhipicephalus sanguineus TaxID=34632 RepID=C9W1J3_RHISA